MTSPRIAVAGAGYIGLAHIDVIQKSPLCALSAIVDPSPKSQDVAAAAGVRHFQSLEALFAQDRPDGVVLATPNVLHVPQAMQCLAAGVPILLEKPIAPTLTEAAQLVAAVASQKGRVLIGHHRAHSPIMAQAKAMIDDGRLGRLVSVMGSALFFKPDSYFAEAPWRTQVGGGPVLINLIHEIHNLRMLCGDIVEVQAMCSNAVRGYAVEDTAAINFRFASGVLATFLVSDTSASARSWEQTSQENKAYASYGDEDCYVIAGTMGSLSVPTMRLKTYANEQDRSWYTPYQCSTVALQREDPLVLQIAHFVDMIRHSVAPRVSARDGLQNLLVVEAIVKAAQTQQAARLS